MIQLAMPILAVLGISYAQRHGVHIRMDILIERLRGRTLWAIETFNALVTLGILALLLLLGRGIATARRAPTGRALFVAGFALAPFFFPPGSPGGAPLTVTLAALWGGGAAFAIAWLRRADARALAAASISFAALPALEPALFPAALAGLLALTVSTARPSRARALRASLGMFLIVALPTLALSNHSPILGGLAGDGSALRGLLRAPAAAWLLTWITIAFGSAVHAHRRSAPTAVPTACDSIDAPRRELRFLSLATLLSVPAVLIGARPESGLAALSPLLALASALLALRAERPGSPR
jgi:hypothetical protein